MHIRKVEQFNILVVGTGGQGLITLLQIIAEAALTEGKEIRTSELHGLSQRGGSVEVHIRFGREIYSPMVAKGKADLILGLEMQEALKGISFSSKKTKFLLNKFIVPIPLKKSLSEKEILKNLKKISKKIQVVPAAEICQKELGTSVVAGIYLLSLASFKKLIPLKPDSILKAIKKVIPEKYLELNLKTFNLAKS
ncbi:indolepyruvate oxidoreductase subunit beta [Patescibacteria group bacterium]